MDKPICMIDVEDSNAIYYYHYDALGSIVALSDSEGDTVQVYEYDVYGQVAASDPDHSNPFLFTGRRYDTETGLYYYRARYYNPTTGRFLQTDPIGYGDGMNLYRYCRNNPLLFSDPLGTDPDDEGEDKTDYYVQDYPGSCVAAAIQNILLEIKEQYEQTWEIPDEWIIRALLEVEMGYENPTGNTHNWNRGGPKAEHALSVINDFLACTDIGIEYELVEACEWDTLTMQDSIDLGPILYAIGTPMGLHAEVLVDVEWRTDTLLFPDGTTKTETDYWYDFVDPINVYGNLISLPLDWFESWLFFGFNNPQNLGPSYENPILVATQAEEDET